MLELLEQRRLLAIDHVAWHNTLTDGDADLNNLPENHNSWDLTVSTSSDWTSSRLEVELTTGTIFNATSSLADGSLEPDPQWASYPVEDGGNLALNWDSYVTTPDGAGSTVFFDSQPGDGISDTQFKLGWSDAVYSGPGQHRIAKLTLSDDAEGTFRAEVFDSETTGVVGTEIHGVIVNGTPVVDNSHLPVSALPSDMDRDGFVTGLDFLAWQRGSGMNSGATIQDGDANGDQAVDGIDLAIWESGYPAVTNQEASPNEEVPVAMADFDDSGAVTGLDFLAWQRGTGTSSGASQIDGDADGDQSVGASDLDVWGEQYGLTSDEITADAVFSFPSPLSPVNPPGSLVYEETIATTVGFAGDTDSFTIDVDDGQTITVVVETDNSLQAVAELFDPLTASLATTTATVAGEDAVIQSVSTTGPGTYTVSVGGIGGTTGSYTVRIILNAAIEAELHDGPTNNTLATAQDINPSFLGLGFGTAERGAVLGQGDVVGTAPPTSDYYRFPLKVGQSASLVLTVSSGSGESLELLDSSGSLLTTGVAAANADQVISNFVSARGGTYYARVTAGFSDYSLIVTRDADFDTNANSDFPTAQDLSPSGTVLGNVGSGGTVVLNAVDRGWFRDDGVHSVSNKNTITGQDGSGTDLFRSFFVFDLSTINGSFSSATLNLELENYYGPDSIELLDIYDVSATASELGTSYFVGDPIGLAIFDDLGSGSTYATSTFTSSDVGSVRSIVLDAQAVQDIRSSVGNTFAVGGRVRGPFTLPSGDEGLRFSRSSEPRVHQLVLESAGNSFYSFEVTSGDNLSLQTSIPANGTGEFLNDLDIEIELFDPTGASVALSPSGAITHTSLMTGTYVVRVGSENDTTGEYVLDVSGATGGVAGFAVTSTDPVDGEILTISPTELEVNFSDLVLLSTIDATDLQVNGTVATNVVIVDSDTVRFTIPALAQGTNNVTLAAGAVTNLQNRPLQPYTGTLFLDTNAPRVISTSIQEGGAADAGSLVVTIGFDEELDSTNLDANDVRLVGNQSGSQVPTVFDYDAGASILTLEYENLAEDQFSLTLISGDGAFEDLIGLNLDGEPLAFPLPPNSSGDGIEGGNFVVNFHTDFGTAPYPVPLEAKAPLGSLIYDPTISGLIGGPGDTDSFTIDVDEGQTITVVIETDSSLQAATQLYNPGNFVIGSASAAAAGDDAVIQTISTTGPGTYTVTVGGAGGTTGTYSVQIILNAAVEVESHDGLPNDILATAQNLNPSFIGLGFGTAERGAVLGQGDGRGAGTLSQTQENNVFWPNVLTYDFTAAPTPFGDGVLTLSGVMDLGSSTEFLTLNAEGLFTQNLFVNDGGEMSFVSQEINLTQAQLATMLADDGNITLTVAPSSQVDNLGIHYLTLDLDYPTTPLTTDFYSFSLAAGQSATLALTGLSGSDAILELLDTSGNLLTTGVAAANLDQVIRNFVSASGGTYYAHVIADSIDYSLVVTRDADLDTEGNSDLTTAQSIGPHLTTLGYLGRQAPGSRAPVNPPSPLPPVQFATDESAYPAHGEAQESTIVDMNRMIVRFGDLGEMSMLQKIADMGASLVTQLDIINGALIEFSATAISAAMALAEPEDSEPISDIAMLEMIADSLESDSSIIYAEPDFELSITETFPNDNSFSSLWGMHNTGQTGGTPDADIDAPEAWDIFTGSTSVVIAGIDSGIDYNHPDLVANMWQNPRELGGTPGVDDDGNGYIDDIYGIDTYNGDSDPMDDNSHGTHTAGTFGGVGNNGTGVAGVNWDVEIMALKFLGASGSGSTAGAIEAIEYMTMMKVDYGVNIVVSNNSWGGGQFSTALQDAIQASTDAGILFVASSGNNGRNADISPSYPAAYDLDGIVSVASTDHNDQRASTSNYGLVSVDLGAPGVNVYSTEPRGSYGFKSGTSMAAPHVAGAAAMLMASNPNATLAEVKDILLTTADPIPALSGITVSGARLNLANALATIGDEGDFYEFEVNAQDNLVLSTLTPAGGPYEFINDLDPLIELYDPAGNLVASDDNSAPDGRNASLSYSALSAGTYTARVLADDSSGEYVLNIAGATGQLPDFSVTETDPIDGSIFTVSPTEIEVDFSSQILLSTIDASDLQVNGLDALSVTVVDSDTLRFTLPALVEGTNSITLADGVLSNLQNQSLAAYAGTVVLDTIAPRVISTSIQEGDSVNAGHLAVTIEFDEELDATNLDAGDVLLVGNLSGSQVPTVFNYDSGTSTLTLEYANLPEDQFTLALISGNGAFEDLIGWDLDGEPLAFPLPPNESGDGTPGGDFVLNFVTDFGIAPYPVPLAAKTPLGSLIYDPTISGLIGTIDDRDSFTIDVDDGQTITVVVETDSSLQASVELIGPGSASLATSTSALAGEDAVIQTIPTAGAGTYTMTVDGAGGTTGSYTVQIILNAAIEEELHDGLPNDALSTAQNIDPSFISLGFGTAERGAVLGRGESGPAGSLSLRQDNNVFWPNVLSHDFTTAPTPLSDGVLTLSGVMDLGSSSESLLLNAEGLFTRTLFATDGGEMTFVSTTVNLTQSQLEAMLADDGTITFTVNPSPQVDNLGLHYLTLDLSYSTAPATTDYYSFSLAAGQSASLALTDQSGNGGTLQLLDSGGNLLATGMSAANVDQVINNFVSATGGTYYAHVITGNVDYSLVVTKDADFDTEPNNDLASAQDISLAGAVLGALGGVTVLGQNSQELIQNGSFETGDFTDWVIETIGDPFRPWSVSGGGQGGGFSLAVTEPQDGSFVAWNGFDGGGPMEFRMYQDVSLPIDVGSAILSWQDRAQWDFVPGGIATEPREYEVQVRVPGTDTVLETLFSFTTGTQDTNPTGDTGWQSHSADLSAYAGQTIQLYFLEEIPQSFTGPGQIEFDAISLVYEPIDDDYYSVDVIAGEKLSILTTIPAAGPGEFVNDLDLEIELFGPDGSTVAFDTDGSIDHMASMTGTYVIRVGSENDTSGEYVLAVNSPPVITDTDLSLSSDSIIENQVVTLDGVFQDVNSAATHTVLVDWGDGTSSLATVNQQADSFTATHQYLDDGTTPGGSPSETYPITVIVTNDYLSLSSDQATASIEVLNEAPVITSFTSDPGDFLEEGETVNISASFSDVGTLDTHSATIDWNDGAGPQPVALTQGVGGGTISASHSYADGGFYHVELTITDDDTGVGTSSTVLVVTGSGVKDGVLYLVGEDRIDMVNVSKFGNHLIVFADFFKGPDIRTFNASSIDAISVHLFDSSDLLTVANNVTLPLFVDAGAGNDLIHAGGGSAILLGGSGDDKLYAGNQRSLLIGGTGRDILQSGSSGDILIGGSTAYDSNEKALMLILDEWDSDRSYLERTDNIANGLGPILDGTDYRLEAGDTVFDDGEFDAVLGIDSEDWLWED